jgi:hypothetical protein
MLAYLEDLCTALLAHDAVAIHRLLAHPLARSLPRQVREEALAISRANPTSLRAPIQMLRFYHQTLQLGDDDSGAAASHGEQGDTDADSHPVASAGPRSPGDDLRGVLLDGRPRDQIEIPFDHTAVTPVAA